MRYTILRLILVSLIAAAPSITAQVAIGNDSVTVEGRGVVSTTTCTNGQVAQFNTTGGVWECADGGGGGDTTGLCALYALTGQTADVGLGCPAQIKKHIFLSSTTHDGDLGGFAGADAECNTRAAAGGLPGTYMAWLGGSSTSSDPESSFTQAAPTTWYVLPNQGIVAIGWSDLTDGQLARSINEFEDGTLVTTNNTAWTNVNADGTRQDATAHCQNWTNNSFPNWVKYFNDCNSGGEEQYTGLRGSISVSHSQWTQVSNGLGSCCDADGGTAFPPSVNSFRRLVCVQQ